MRLVTSQSWVAAHPSVPWLQAGRFQATHLQDLRVPGSYPGSLPWDKLFQQQREIIRDVFLAFSAGNLSLGCLALSSPSHIHLQVTASQLSFPFRTHLPTPCCYPRRMALSHSAVPQGTEKNPTRGWIPFFLSSCRGDLDRRKDKQSSEAVFRASPRHQ